MGRWLPAWAPRLPRRSSTTFAAAARRRVGSGREAEGGYVGRVVHAEGEVALGRLGSIDIGRGTMGISRAAVARGTVTIMAMTMIVSVAAVARRAPVVVRSRGRRAPPRRGRTVIVGTAVSAIAAPRVGARHVVRSRLYGGGGQVLHARKRNVSRGVREKK